MRLGLYGVTKSGKDYLINYLVKEIDNLNTLNGSTILKAICKEKNWNWNKLSIEKKNFLRKAFVDYAQNLKNENVIIDGHYSFIDNNGYEVVMTKKDIDFYDNILYLNTNANLIIQRTLDYNNKHANKKTVYKADRIKEWKDFEIKELQNICNRKGTELIVIDDDMEIIKDFIIDILGEGLFSDCNKIADYIISNNKIFEEKDEFILTDCDRTLSLRDESYSIINKIGIPRELIKQIFKGEYYSTYSFYKMARLYDNTCKLKDYCEKESCNTELCSWLLEEFHELNMPIIAITSGIYDYWDNILAKNNLANYILLGGNSLKNNKYLVSKGVKKRLVLILQRLGKKIYAFGDSPVDYGMLESADKSFILCNEKISRGLVELLKINNINAFQFDRNKYYYDKLKKIQKVGDVI